MLHDYWIPNISSTGTAPYYYYDYRGDSHQYYQYYTFHNTPDRVPMQQHRTPAHMQHQPRSLSPQPDDIQLQFGSVVIGLLLPLLLLVGQLVYYPPDSTEEMIY